MLNPIAPINSYVAYRGTKATPDGFAVKQRINRTKRELRKNRC